MSQTSVKDSTGTPVNIENPLPPGRALAAASKPFTLAIEDKAALDLITTTIAARMAATLGAKTAANSMAVAIATDDPMSLAIGNKADTVASSDTGTFSLIALTKRLLQFQSDSTPTPVIDGGAQYETVAASQTNQVLGGAGAIGDAIAGVWFFPGSTTPAAWSVLDNTTTVFAWPAGITLTDTRPIFIPLGDKSASGAWKITTGANCALTVHGKFT